MTNLVDLMAGSGLVSSKTMDSLRGIGLNLYERKLWIALLARGASTAGELSEISNVPRSRAYDILQSLADKGFAVVQNAKPIRYVAVAPEEALERAKRKMQEDVQSSIERIDELKESPIMRELSEIFTKGMKLVSADEMTGSLKGKYSVTQHINTMLKTASDRIHIMTTAEGMNELIEHHIDHLKKAKDRGVSIKIATVSNNRSEDAIKALAGLAEVRHIDEKELPVSGRFCVVDGKEMVMGLTDPKSVHSTQDIAIWSKSEHAAGKMIEPIFKMVWNNSKAVN